MSFINSPVMVCFFSIAPLMISLYEPLTAIIKALEINVIESLVPADFSQGHSCQRYEMSTVECSKCGSSRSTSIGQTLINS